MTAAPSEIIARLEVTRVRSILNADIPLAPLTIIVGPNGSGKSNILRSIFLCTIVSRHLLSERDGRAHQPRVEWRGIWGGHHIIKAMEAVELYAASQMDEARVRLTLCLPPDSAADPAYRGTAQFGYTKAPDQQGRVAYEINAPDVENLLQLLGRVAFIPTDRLFWDLQDPGLGRESHRTASFLEEQDRALISCAGFVHALARISRQKLLREMFIDLGRGLFGVDWAHLVREDTDWQQYIEHPELIQPADLSIGRKGVRLPFHLASLGTRQFFPILVHSLAMLGDLNGVLLTEEPEISLHPKAQVAVGEYLAHLPRASIQIVTTTHSHYVVLGVCKQVRAGVIAPEHVALLDCSKGQYGTKVRRIPIDEHGVIEGGIPSFAEVDEYLFEDWVKSI